MDASSHRLPSPLVGGGGVLLVLAAVALSGCDRSGTVALETEPAVVEVIVAVEGQGRKIFESAGGRLELTLPAGRHPVQVRADDHEPAELVLVVTSGELTQERVELALLMGSAHFEVEPDDAELTLAVKDGEAMEVALAGGETTRALAPGEYTVTARAPGYETFHGSFALEPGEEEDVLIDLERKARARAPQPETRTETQVVPVPGYPGYVPRVPYVPGVPRPPRPPRPRFP